MKRILLFSLLVISVHAQSQKTVTPNWVKSVAQDTATVLRAEIALKMNSSAFADSFNNRFSATSIAAIKEVAEYGRAIADSSILLYSGGVWSIFDLSEALSATANNAINITYPDANTISFNDTDVLLLDPLTLEINGSGQLTVIGGTGGSVGNADSLGGKPASEYLVKNDSTAQRTFSDLKYVDKASTQTITGNKTFSGNKTVFGTTMNDSVGIRGRLNVDGIAKTTQIQNTDTTTSLATADRYGIENKKVWQYAGTSASASYGFYNRSLFSLSSGMRLGSHYGFYQETDFGGTGGIMQPNIYGFYNKLIYSRSDTSAAGKFIYNYFADVAKTGIGSFGGQYYGYYSTISSGIINSIAYHFYGAGNYPSYFGGDIELPFGSLIFNNNADTLTQTELGYLDGLKSNVQEQLNAMVGGTTFDSTFAYQRIVALENDVSDLQDSITSFRNILNSILTALNKCGCGLPEMLSDFYGNPRGADGNWDIGAVEYQTGAVDSLPNAFAFTDITNATRSTLYTSNAVTLAGFDSAYAYAGGAEYTVYNIGDIPPYTYITGYTKVFPGDIIRVKQTSSSSYSTATNVILTVGGRSDTYTITTKSAPALSGGSKVLKVNGGILKDSSGKVIKVQ